MSWKRALPLATLAALAGCAGLDQLGAVNPSERADVRNACEAKARSDHLDIVRWHGVREVGPSQFEVPLTVNYRGREYERLCVYDERQRAVDIREGAGSYGGHGNDGWSGGAGGGLGNQASERARARDACEAKARGDDLQIVSWGAIREVYPDRWETPLRVEWKGKIYERTCAYDDRGKDVKIVDR